MHQARIAAFLLGAWIFGGLLMAYIATVNLDTVDSVLKAPLPEASRMTAKLGAANNARQLFRYMTTEQNQVLFSDWEVAQIVIGLLLAGVLLLGLQSRMLTAVAGALVLLTAFQHLKITPELTWLGRSINFITWTSESLQRNQFWKLHTVYQVIELVKLLLSLVMLGFLFAMKRRRARRRRVELDDVDYAHHRHVDR